MSKATDWITALSGSVVAVIAAGALWYAHAQISEAHKEAQVQHLLEMDQRYSQEPMVTYRKLYAKKRIAGGDPFPEEERLLDYFETVALLANSGYLKDMDVWETFSLDIFPLYADARDTIDQDQKDDPTEYSNLVALVSRLEAIDVARNGKGYKPSKDDIADYWKDEASIGVGTPTRKRKVAAASK
jgi:hypothetical protein